MEFCNIFKNERLICMNIFCGSRSLCQSSSNNCARGIGDDSGLGGERRVTPNDTASRPRRPCILNTDSFLHLLTLKMKSLRSVESSVTIYQSSRRNIPEVPNLKRIPSFCLNWGTPTLNWPPPPTHCIRNCDIIKNQDYLKWFRSIVPPRARHRWRCSLSDVNWTANSEPPRGVKKCWRGFPTP
jgi:hypothetical protein